MSLSDAMKNAGLVARPLGMQAVVPVDARKSAEQQWKDAVKGVKQIKKNS